MDEFYPKRPGGAGHHGGEYQLKVILFFFLKAFEGRSDFKLSSENPKESALDDAVLLDEDKNILASVKHSENRNGQIHIEALFSESHAYSILTPLKSYKQKYLEHLKDLSENIQRIPINDVSCITTLKEYAKTAVEDFKSNCSNYEKIFNQLSEKIYELKDKTLIRKIEWFENIKPYLIINIEPHEQIKKELVSEKHFIENDFFFTEVQAAYYIFKPVEILAKIRSISSLQEKFSDFFVTQFCKKFKLVILEDELLERNMGSKLRNLDLYKKGHVSLEIAYNHFFKKIKEWYGYYKNGKNGYFLTRFHFEVMFSNLWSKVYVTQLKTIANKFQFETESLVKKIDEKSVTLINSPRYLLLMAKLQEKWYKEIEKEQILFINPNDNIDLQKCSTESFLYYKYTHLVCPILDDKNQELVSNVNNILPNLQFKKVVLITDFNLNIQHPSIHIINDQELFGNVILKDIRRMKSMGDMGKYYVPRHFELQNDTYSEETFLKTIVDSSEKFILVVDGPGAGKTTLLTNITCKINQRDDLCAINIQLNQFTNVLKEGLKKNNLELEDFLSCTTIEDVERQIYTIPKIMYLTIDAVDEIAPKYTDLVLSFLKNVSNRVAKIIVSSREHLKTDLSVCLNVTPYSLRLFTSEEQKKFIISYWISNLSLKNEDRIEKCKNYCDLLLKDLKYALREFHKFLGMPLQTKMIAEIFLKGCQQYLDNEYIIASPDNISLTRLYELFIDRRKEIYLENCNIQGNVAAEQALLKEFNSYITLCEEISVRLFFSKEYWNLFSLKEDDFTKYDEILYYKMGLLILPTENCWSYTHDSEESDTGHNVQRPQFIHRSFGEYFAAKTICRKLFDDSIAKPKFTELILNIFLKDMYTNIRRFIKSTLANNYERNNAEIERQFQEVLQNTVYAANINFNMLPYRGFLHNLNMLLGSTDLPKEWIHNRNDLCIRISKDARSVITFSVKKDTLLTSSIKHLYILKLLIADGTEINLKELLDKTVLHCAEGLGYIHTDLGIVEETDSIGTMTKFGLYFSLHKVPSCNYHTEVVKLLVEKGASVTCSEYGLTTLHYATKSNNLELIKFLISKGVDVNEQTTGFRFFQPGQTAFHIAFMRKYFEICEYLLNVQNINVNVKNSKGWGLWSYAVASDESYFEFINKIKDCYNIEIETDSEALCIVVRNNNATRLQRLLDLGFDINSKNQEGWSPLLVSVKENKKDMFTFLIDKGADEKATTETGSTILHVAAFYTGDLEIFKLVEKHFDDINSKNLEGETVLHQAAVYGDLQLVEYICKKSKTLPFENSLDGRTCLHYAVYRNSLKTLQYLVEKVGIPLDAQEENGKTALHFAVELGHMDIVQFLVDKMKNEKIDLNFKINESLVLFVPSSKFRNEITEILLESGVNENIIERA